MHIFAKSEPSLEMEMALRLVILSIFAFYTIDGKILFFDILTICLLCKVCIFKRHRANAPIPVDPLYRVLENGREPSCIT